MYMIYTDEMYAAIIDPSNNVYTSGSETYAQIPSANNIPVASTGQTYKASTSHINGPEQTHSRQGNSSYNILCTDERWVKLKNIFSNRIIHCDVKH